MSMTPIKLEILLHYFACSGPYPRSSAPAVQDAITYLITHDLLERCAEQPYDVTEKGAAYIKHLLSIPFPVKQWIIP